MQEEDQQYNEGLNIFKTVLHLLNACPHDLVCEKTSDINYLWIDYA